ncbi:MAG TPA: nitroreductase [Bacillales bacterium]|nr:nitroreductase [Bacillales bacterium]
MEVLKAIRTRRSIGKVSERTPEKEHIQTMLEAARWAPNHHKTEPWHFYVLTGKGRDRLGEVYGQINVEKIHDPSADEKKQAIEAGLQKARRSPVVIVVTVEPAEGAMIEPIEEIAAASCAVQNVLLVAHDLGLAVKWRTGKPAFHPYMKQVFNVSENGSVLGFLYVGYPEEEPKPPGKKPLHEYVTWHEN